MKILLIASLLITLSADLSAQNCSNTSTGRPPINDLGTNYWRGYQGGLYPDGSNYKPTVHYNAGMMFASQVQPLDTNGNPNTNGRYVLLSIGMSNTTQEFSRFMQIAQASGQVNSRLRIVDGAQGGADINVILDSNAVFWSNVMTRLRNNGVSRFQV